MRFFSTMEKNLLVSNRSLPAAGRSKLRAKFNHTPFETMLRTLVKKEYSGEYVLSTWHDYHLLSVDGSYSCLPAGRL
jgi:hypothetical protein